MTGDAFPQSMSDVLSPECIRERLIELRGQQVLIDADVARIYGVETKRVNEAVKNNPHKFPEGYILELSALEWSNLKSKFSTSSLGGKQKVPSAFTERGLYMLATILKSKRATEATLLIIETYAKLREITRSLQDLSQAKDDNHKKQLIQRSGTLFSELLDDHLSPAASETSLELNFAVLKLRHTVSRKRDGK